MLYLFYIRNKHFSLFTQPLSPKRFFFVSNLIISLILPLSKKPQANQLIKYKKCTYYSVLSLKNKIINMKNKTKRPINDNLKVL